MRFFGVNEFKRIFKYPLMAIGALKSVLMHEWCFGKFGTQIEKETIKVVRSSLINTRESGVDFTLHIRNKKTLVSCF